MLWTSRNRTCIHQTRDFPRFCLFVACLVSFFVKDLISFCCKNCAIHCFSIAFYWVHRNWKIPNSDKGGISRKHALLLKLKHNAVFGLFSFYCFFSSFSIVFLLLTPRLPPCLFYLKHTCLMFFFNFAINQCLLVVSVSLPICSNLTHNIALHRHPFGPNYIQYEYEFNHNNVQKGVLHHISTFAEADVSCHVCVCLFGCLVFRHFFLFVLRFLFCFILFPFSFSNIFPRI